MFEKMATLEDDKLLTKYLKEKFNGIDIKKQMAL